MHRRRHIKGGDECTRRAWLAAAPAGLLAAVLSGACADENDEARRLAVEWFTGELKRIGYADKGSGLYGTPPKAAAGLLLGDALEVQIKDIQVTAVRDTVINEQDRDRGTTWRGQVFFNYQLREQYHKDGQPKGWSPWQKESGILSLEKRAGQWYVSRVK